MSNQTQQLAVLEKLEATRIQIDELTKQLEGLDYHQLTEEMVQIALVLAFQAIGMTFDCLLVIMADPENRLAIPYEKLDPNPNVE